MSDEGPGPELTPSRELYSVVKLSQATGRAEWYYQAFLLRG
jgi:hypothetical protein